MSQPDREAQWKSDPDIIYCPTCNYGCKRDWNECPMCHTLLGEAGRVTQAAAGVPMFVDDVEATEGVQAPTSKPSILLKPLSVVDEGALRQAVLDALAPVISTMGVISMRDLASQCNAPEGTVLRIVKDLVATDIIEGHIDPGTNEYISEIAQKAAPIFDEHPSAPARLADVGAIIKEEQDGTVDQFVKDLVNALELKRGYDFEGGRVHFKVSLKNNSKLVINDIKVYLDVPDFFKIDEEESSKTIPVLNPGESRGLDFYLDPRKCGTSEISATVLFKDIYGKRHAKLVTALEIQIKQPIVAPSKTSIEFTKALTERLASDMKMFSFKDLDAELLYNAAFRAVSKFDMACVHDEKSDQSMEAWFSAISKVDKEPIIARIIVSTEDNVLEVRIWCNDDKQLTGFMAKVITNLRDEIELIRRIKTEDKSEALKLMSLGRNIEVLKNFAGLNWQAGDICNTLEEIRAILEETLAGKLESVIDEMETWCETLRKQGPEEHIPEDLANQLYNDVEKWQDLINMQLGIAKK